MILFLLIGLPQLACLQAKPRDIPYRIDPLQTPAPNGTTLLLWSFENGTATDATIGRNNGKLRGRFDPSEGRFGKGLRLQGGSVLLSEKVSIQHLVSSGEEAVVMVDFWCKLKSFPAGKDACLLEIPGALGVRLELTTAGHLHVRGPDLKLTESKNRVPLNEWFHVAIFPKALLQPNGIYIDKNCMAVLLNGATEILAKMPQYRPLSSEPNPLSVGNSFKQDASFDGWLDEFRISRGAAGFYEIIRQDFLLPEAAQSLKRSEKHFREPSAEVYAETFDAPGALQKVIPPTQPQLLPTAPAAVRVTSSTQLEPGELAPETEDEKDLVEDLIEGEQQQEKTPPLELVPGVWGKALAVRGGVARVKLPERVDLSDGTLEFWFKPGNWDNLSIPPGSHADWSYNNRYAHLITLWGQPKDGAGQPAQLVSISIRRDQGRPPVAPEFEKFFARPLLPIVPHKWIHVLVTRSKQFSYLNGCVMDAEYPSSVNLAGEETWQTHQAAYVTLGNGYETSYDELRFYSYPFEGVERVNARASFTKDSLQLLDLATVTHQVGSLGNFKVNESVMPLINRFSGGWMEDWVSGTVTRGPVKVFFAYRLAIGKMIVAVVLNDPGSAATADIEFHLPQPEKKLKGQIQVFEESKGGVVLDVGLLPEGNFPVKGTLFNKAGEKVADFESAFHRMPLPWLHNKLGLPETPPPPFEPVTVKGQTVMAVQREHVVGSDGNYSSIKVIGVEILASPIRLEVESGGKVNVFKGQAPAKIEHALPVETNWQASANAPGLTARSKVHFEYDGTAKYQLDIEPAQDVVVDRLSLQIPLKAEYGQLIHVLPTEGSFRDYVTAGFLPPGDGPLWDSKTWKKDYPVSTGAKGNFASMLWLGGPVRGLVWFADTDKGWTPNDERPAATITRKDGVVTIGLHFINEPLSLKSPLQITFGILATPPKPLPHDYRLWNRGNPKEVGPISWRLTSCDAFAPFKVPLVEKAFDYWPRGDDWEFARMAMHEQRNLWKSDIPHGKYPEGTSLILYQDANKCPVHPKMKPYFQWEWRWRSYSWTRLEHLVWYMNQWITNGIDGFYIDDIFPGGDWNLEPLGTSYLLPNGQKQLGASHFYYREFLKRFYALFHAHGKRPIITTHMTDTLLWPEHAFVSAIYDGEHGARGHGANKTYIDAWPLDYLMTIRNAERTGLITVNFGLQVPDNWQTTAPPLWQYIAQRSREAVILLFDSSNPPGPVGQRYYGKDVEVFPFWRNEHLVQVEPVFKKPVKDRDLPVRKWWTRISDNFHRSLAKRPLRATLYRKGNRGMVVVVNFLRRSIDAKVTLNLDELGIPPADQARLAATDIDDWLPPPGTDLETLHVADVPRTRTGALLTEIKEKGGFPVVPEAGDAGEEDEADLETQISKPEGDGFRLSDSEEDKLPAERGKFYNVNLKGNVLRLNVAGHNFRAIELRWDAITE
ncbi:MAG: DUF6067 family protein [Planctomycetota bacterium]|nr:DUF6067 family protein [Planctomycetota bacterium]